MQRRSSFVRSRRSLRALESLEGRRLLSSVLNAGVLTLTGGGGNDSFVVTKSGSNVSVVENGQAAKLFALAGITRINASLAGGNDTINIGNRLTIPASVSGGDGDDGIITGAGNDTLDGGIGNDYLEGRDGDDTASYAGRTEPITASLTIEYSPVIGSDTQPPTITRAGGGGAEGENDSFSGIDTLTGGAGDDTLSLEAGEFYERYSGTIFPPKHTLQVNGGGGDDVLSVAGSRADDYSPNSFLKEIADGGSGDDVLIASYSSVSCTTLIGGDGDDYFTHVGTDDDEAIDAGGGSDTYRCDAELTPEYTMPAGLERLVVSNGEATKIFGNDEANIIEGELHYVDARGGNDFIHTTYGEGGTVLGGEGNDRIESNIDGQFIDAGPGDDLIGLYGSDYKHSDQTVVSGSGNDTLAMHDYDLYWTYTATAHLAGPESFDAIYIGDIASVVVEKGATPEANVLRVNQLFISNEHDDPSGAIDLNDNPMIVSKAGYFDDDIAYTGVNLRDYIKSGRDGAPYSGGPGGIESSVVDATPGMAIGYARADELFTSFPATFAGQSVAATDYIVRPTRAGDVNLDRKVDFADLVILAQNYGQTGWTYAQGDVSLSNDGTVDFDDLVILSQGYGSSFSTVASSIFAPGTSVKAVGKKKPAVADRLGSL